MLHIYPFWVDEQHYSATNDNTKPQNEAKQNKSVYIEWYILQLDQ